MYKVVFNGVTQHQKPKNTERFRSIYHSDALIEIIILNLIQC